MKPIQIRARGLTIAAFLVAQFNVIAEEPPVTQMDEVVVTSRSSDLLGIAQSASEGYVGSDDLGLRPLMRPGEIVEQIPGVIITQHSGSGKANQYFLRGFNLDHGTDLAISLDGIPVNMVSHAHGQGYSDLNFLIPELVHDVAYKKGTYYADVGDFGTAGAFNIEYYNKLPNGLAVVEGGQSGYERGMIANNAAIGKGILIYAFELEHNDGPWDHPDDALKLNTVLRYSIGDEEEGLSITAMGYHNNWHSTDQVPDRAIEEGLISRWGAIDPSDGGNSTRLSLSAEWHRQDDQSATHVLLYGVYYDLDLFSNFTYFLEDPVHGDQIEQKDRRTIIGGKASHTFFGELFGHKMQNTFGIDIRSDDILNGLYHTEDRARLGTTQHDRIVETGISPYYENQFHWTSWLRTVAGIRADIYNFDVRSLSGGDSGTKTSAIASPKLSVILGPWAKTELYLNAGLGFHSNDARGVVSKSNPATPLVRGKGAEVGIRTGIIPGLQSSLTFWVLDLNSELVWDGDEGDNTPSGPSRRYGVEFANFYNVNKWLTIDADFAWSHTRFTDNEPDGNYVPEALVGTIDAGIAIHDIGPFFADLRLRYFGPRPLTQDGSVSSKSTTILYAEAGWHIDKTWTLSVSMFNLLNSNDSDIDYYYTSRLPGEPLSGVDDIHTHPAEPRELRVALSAKF